MKKDGNTLIKYIEALSDQDKYDLMNHYENNDEKIFIQDSK